MQLTEDQKKYIRENHSKTPDLIELTRTVFQDDTIDGRSKEGRAVRKFCAEENIDFRTTKHEKVEDIEISPEQKEFILEYARDGINPYQIAALLFPDKGVTPLSKETLVITEFLNENGPEGQIAEATGYTFQYIPPSTPTVIVNKINEASSTEWQPNKLSIAQRDCVDSIKRYMSSPRFSQTIGAYLDENDRLLFEAEFVRAVFDKADLTNDEVNLYINVCMDYIHLKNISSAIDKLNRMFEECEDQRDMTVRLAELLKTKSEEYNQCEKRQETLIGRLNGDRKERIKNSHQNNASILSLVKLFQNEEDRKRMVDMAEKQKILISEETNRVEHMDSWKARVLGISKEEAT